MIRLTYNTGRRGFFALYVHRSLATLHSSAEQDYRYTYIKQHLPTWAFQLIHLFAVGMSSI